MVVTIKDGMLKVVVDVVKPVIAQVKDEYDGIIEEYAFYKGVTGVLGTDKFVANAVTDDGKYAIYIPVDTTSDTVKDDIKKCYGKALVAVKKYEPIANARLQSEAEAEAQFNMELDEIIG